MVEIPENIKKLAIEAVKKKTLVMGTANKKFIPNAIPLSAVGYPKIIDDDKFVILDNYLLKTKENLEENPIACLTFWDPETREGYQVKGSIEIKSSGDLFEKIISDVKNKAPKLSPRAIVILKIKEVYNIKPGEDAGKRIL